MSIRGRKIFVSHSEIAILADDLSYSKNRHSETVDRVLVSQNSIPGPKFPTRVFVLVHRVSYPPVGCGYLFARGSELPAMPQFRIDTSTRSVNGYIQRFLVRRPNSSPGALSQAADAIVYGHRFA
ncbi:hypothetical protein Taro_048902 [Colocasia esculenta]|uniref:Uncharacterized protein n=1 Tax=Colocasia esculenta TaxID=4460 RepID=A0A843X9K3_COLES|nr:hypothetical protein [Colocasia esculenta]